MIDRYVLPHIYIYIYVCSLHNAKRELLNAFHLPRNEADQRSKRSRPEFFSLLRWPTSNSQFLAAPMMGRNFMTLGIRVQGSVCPRSFMRNSLRRTYTKESDKVIWAINLPNQTKTEFENQHSLAQLSLNLLSYVFSSEDINSL